MTSRKKITAISKAAKKYECAVYLKTGAHPPGVMISECQVEGMEGLAGWAAAVKRLRYKDYHHVRSEVVNDGQLSLPFGHVKEFETMKALAADLDECGVLEWWEEAMGFTRKSDDQGF